MAIKSKSLNWLQLIISALILAWLSYDFFHTLFNGVTYTLRLDSQIPFHGNALPFLIAVVIKLGFYYFSVKVLKECIKNLKG